MKLTILQENLLSVLQDAIKFIPSKPQIPILACFLLEAKEGVVKISATDLSIGIETSVVGKIEKNGVFAVPAKVFVECISSLPAGAMTIEVEGEELNIASGKTRASFQGVSAKEYPSIPQKDGKSIKIPQEQFLELIKKGGVAAGIDETRPTFSSILLEGDGEKVSAVSTDGYRLAKKTTQFSGWENGRVLLPAKTIKEVARIIERLGGESVEISISEGLRQAFICAKEATFLVRIVEASFPDYQTIIPESFNTSATFQKDEFLSALKMAMIFSRESSGIVKIAVKKKELMLQSSSSLVGNQESSVSLEKMEGEEKEIAFNGKYLQDFFLSLDGETVKFVMNESLKPGMFTIDWDEGFFYLVMPFRTSSGA